MSGSVDESFALGLLYRRTVSPSGPSAPRQPRPPPPREDPPTSYQGILSWSPRCRHCGRPRRGHPRSGCPFVVPPIPSSPEKRRRSSTPGFVVNTQINNITTHNHYHYQPGTVLISFRGEEGQARRRWSSGHYWRPPPEAVPVPIAGPSSVARVDCEKDSEFAGDVWGQQESSTMTDEVEEVKFEPELETEDIESMKPEDDEEDVELATEDDGNGDGLAEHENDDLAEETKKDTPPDEERADHDGVVALIYILVLMLMFWNVR